MIEKMKVVQVVTTAAHKEAMLGELRKLGIVHFAEKASADKALSDRFNDLSKTALFLKDYAPKEPSGEEKLLSDPGFETVYNVVKEAMERRKDLTARRAAAVTAAEKLREWGDFDPNEIRKLTSEGIDLHFYRLDKKTFAKLAADENVKYVKLSPVEKMDTIATNGPLPQEYPATEFQIPMKGLGQLEKEIELCDTELEDCEDGFRRAAKYLKSFNAQMLKTQNDEEYSSVSNAAGSEEGLIWLSGYIPEDDAPAFKEAAANNGWAWAIDDPAEDDEKIPTKVRYTKLTKLMTPVFDILGTVPGYREYDISFWFLCFFTLFFAMIIGDAGYGVLFLIGAVAFTLKTKKVNNAILLLYVLSAGTIIWGALTGTWFGLEGAMKVPFLKSLVIPSFANYPEYFGVSVTTQQNSIMKFCFIIGTVQLALACVMNIRKKLGQKDLSWVADLGWLCAICALYFVVLFLVIGQSVNLTPVAIVVIIGFLLVVMFGGMEPGKSFSAGLKAGLGNAFTVFLNTISAFGNIMSYIRLFAVGMASLAIAQSFNNMASGFKGPLVVAGAVIMIIGHVLNIVMGFLSVVVHGVRLNLLEFSGQLNMEWSGIAYAPFKKLDKIKK
jgi:V/A-type H+-transporting ATPase subunit I